MQPMKVRGTSADYGRSRTESTPSSEQKHLVNKAKHKGKDKKPNTPPADGLSLHERELEAQRTIEALNMTVDRDVSISDAFAQYVDAVKEGHAVDKNHQSLSDYLAAVLLPTPACKQNRWVEW